jgi:hypothetical protein
MQRRVSKMNPDVARNAEEPANNSAAAADTAEIAEKTA